MRKLTALLAGLVAALLISVVPAGATDQRRTFPRQLAPCWPDLRTTNRIAPNSVWPSE